MQDSTSRIALVLVNHKETFVKETLLKSFVGDYKVIKITLSISIYLKETGFTKF